MERLQIHIFRFFTVLADTQEKKVELTSLAFTSATKEEKNLPEYQCLSPSEYLNWYTVQLHWPPRTPRRFYCRTFSMTLDADKVVHNPAFSLLILSLLCKNTHLLLEKLLQTKLSDAAKVNLSKNRLIFSRSNLLLHLDSHCNSSTCYHSPTNLLRRGFTALQLLPDRINLSCPAGGVVRRGDKRCLSSYSLALYG